MQKREQTDSGMPDETIPQAGQTSDAERLVDFVADTAMAVLDEVGRIKSWNVGAERITGWPRLEVLHLSHSFLYPQEDIASGKPAADLDRARESRRQAGERVCIRKDGSSFTADFQIAHMPAAAEPGAGGFALVIRDITERIAAEAAHNAREAHLRSILETVPDAMIVIDEEARMQALAISRGARQLYAPLSQDWRTQDHWDRTRGRRSA